jgi:hypothetical protein
MKLKFLLFVFSSVSCAYNLNASSPEKIQSIIDHNEWSFVENKGQLATSNPAKLGNDYDLHPEIKYYGHQGGVFIYCKPGKINFVFTRIENETNRTSEASGAQMHQPDNATLNPNSSGQNSKLLTNSTDLILIGSNPNAEIIAAEQQEYYENFYLAHTNEEGIQNVHTYKTLIYKNIYAHIDLILHARKQGIKYEFIVYPGGKVTDIKMRWSGLDKIEVLQNKEIKYSTGYGQMNETMPLVYQICENKNNLSVTSLPKITEISSQFILKNKTIRFKIDNFDHNKKLVIDPVLNWSTYYGGSGDDRLNNVSTDGLGNIYAAGETTTSNGLTTSGAFQTQFGGGISDALITKFSSNGSRLWTTYFGGTDVDIAHGIVSDASGNSYITGETYSISGISSSGSFQTGNGGGVDGFIAKFSSSGARVWSSYYGGDGGDIGSAITIDNSNNVIITGNTNSTSGIASSNGWQVVNGGFNAFIAKFSSAGSRIWGTYFGGTGAEGNSIAADDTGNIFITGRTSSSSGLASSGAYQTSYSGSNDAFIAKFSPLGSEIWSTYFGGPGNDKSFGVALDASGNVIITGSTSSTSGISTSGAYQTSNGSSSSGFDAFIAKFTSAGKILWSTYFGGASYDCSNGVAIDQLGHIYIVGYTASSSSIASTGAFQSSIGGGYDAFIAVFSPYGNRVTSSYFGGTKDEMGYGITIDPNGNASISGLTASSSNIATSSAFQKSFGGQFSPAGGDGFITQLKYSLSGILMENSESTIDVNLFPNPFSSSINIEYHLENTGIVNIRLLDVTGKQIGVIADENQQPGNYHFEISSDKLHLSPGIYLLKLMVNDKVISRNIVKM